MLSLAQQWLLGIAKRTRVLALFLASTSKAFVHLIQVHPQAFYRSIPMYLGERSIV
jgi:hypothetical protein